MKIKSPAFEHNGLIPETYTCEGQNINPSLALVGVSKEAVSLVLIMDDPDVPVSVRADRMWVHWVIYNIPPHTKKIVENATPPGMLGRGTGGECHYQGPCPPDREHRYFFKLYALDVLLELKPGATKKEVEKSMEGHVIEEAVLIGRYCKKTKKSNS